MLVQQQQQQLPLQQEQQLEQHHEQPQGQQSVPSPACQSEQAGSEGTIVHPFETEPGDHAETPPEAYQHIETLLARLAK